MAIHQRLKNWFRQKSRSRKNGQEETVAVPEVHTGKVRHEAADSTPEADCPIHYDNVAIPEIHIHSRKKYGYKSAQQPGLRVRLLCFFALSPPQQKHPLQSVRADRRGCLAF